METGETAMSNALAETVEVSEQVVRFPDTRELAERVENLTKREVVVEDEASYVLSVDVYRALQDFETAAKEEYREEKDLAFKLHRRLCDKESALLRPILEAKRRWNLAMTAFRDRQEVKAREEARKAQERADKAAQREAAKIAKALERQGEPEAAEAVRNQPVVAPIVHQAAAVPEVKGVSSSKKRKAEVIDLLGMVKGIAEGKVPLKAVTANQTFLDQQARSLEDQLDYPGVKVVTELKTNIRKNAF